jgi:molybdenum cofactor synthesis domain-containing protein
MTAPRALVLVCSSRAAHGVYDDTTGPIIRSWLADRGWDASTSVVADGAPVGEALRLAIAGDVKLVISTGGTGLSPTDFTPEETRAVLDREIPGVAEELRRRGAANTPLALLSRGVAGVAGTTLIVNLPGSTGGVRDGLAVLGELLDHLVDQIHGGDHVRAD